MGFPLSALCSGRPIELDKPHILTYAAEIGFLRFKEQVPFNFKNKISAVQCERETFRLISLSTPVSFQWTVLLRRTNVANAYPWGYRCKELIAESPFTSMADNFPAFPAKNWFCDL